jgi:hypothetical protein
MEIGYDNKGQKIRQTDADGVTILFQYVDLGDLEYSAIDVNHDGQINLNGVDLARRFARSFKQDALWNLPVQQVEVYGWDAEMRTRLGSAYSHQTSTGRLRNVASLVGNQ